VPAATPTTQDAAKPARTQLVRPQRSVAYRLSQGRRAFLREHRQHRTTTRVSCPVHSYCTLSFVREL